MKKSIALLIAAGITLGLASGLVMAQEKPAAPPAQNRIPKNVKAAMEEGLAARVSAKADIPFKITENVCMPVPGQTASYIYLLVDVKNADMGYAVPPTPQVVDPTAPPAAAKLLARTYVFVQYYKIPEGKSPSLEKEIYIPAAFQVDQEGYDPEAVEWYSFGYILPAGKYVAAVALSSPDFQKFGIQYYEFSLPTPQEISANLITSPILILKDYAQTEQPETSAELHKGLLAWSIARITPNLERTIPAASPLDLFFFVYGAKPNATGRFDLQIEFEVNQTDGKPAIKFAPGEFKSPLVSLPLEMKQTLQVTTGDKVETKQQDLPAGTYVLVAKISDKVSGLKGESKVEFTVK
ncbi:MAG: hypothetical protein JW843_01980 [Candidatus Aminicenantes bacterium]|nr:hypothetical protein [Candidatus Aminicenantes bacterium]